MAKRKPINPSVTNKGKIPDSALCIKKIKEIGHPVFSFAHVCDKHFLISSWQKDELIELINTFKIMEELPWSRIHNHSGLRFKKIDKKSLTKPLPDKVSPEVTVFEVRVCKVKRVFGYRMDDVFRILWFDRGHQVLPENKVRR